MGRELPISELSTERYSIAGKSSDMLPKPIFILLLGFVLGCAQRQAGDLLLPDLLTEAEKQIILKEHSPKPHIESALKVAETRIKNALRLAQENQLLISAQE